jgi:hypothetical protein
LIQSIVGRAPATALALDAVRGEIVARATLPNDAEITTPSDAARGRSEWDAEHMGRQGCPGAGPLLTLLSA